MDSPFSVAVGNGDKRLRHRIKQTVTGNRWFVMLLFHQAAGILNYIFLLLGLSSGQNYPPPLPPGEERALFVRMKRGDEEARAALIEHNLRLVSHIVRKYYCAAKNPDDLVSIGSIGLIKAVDTFDFTNGSFSILLSIIRASVKSLPKFEADLSVILVPLRYNNNFE